MQGGDGSLYNEGFLISVTDLKEILGCVAVGAPGLGEHDNPVFGDGGLDMLIYQTE